MERMWQRSKLLSPEKYGWWLVVALAYCLHTRSISSRCLCPAVSSRQRYYVQRRKICRLSTSVPPPVEGTLAFFGPYSQVTCFCVLSITTGSRSMKSGCLTVVIRNLNPYPTAFPYGNGMVLHFYQQQESSTTKTVHKVINKRLKTYVQSPYTGENFH